MFNDFRCVDYNNLAGAKEMKMNMNVEMDKVEAKMPAVEPCVMPNMGPKMGGCPMPGTVCQPVMECPVEKCVHRNIVHEVPHVCPVNTKIINHHIYRHTYSPHYTCCEENTVCNVNEGSCCNYR